MFPARLRFSCLVCLGALGLYFFVAAGCAGQLPALLVIPSPPLFSYYTDGRSDIHSKNKKPALI